MIWMSRLEFRTLKLIWSFTAVVHGQSPHGPQHILHSSQSYLCPASKGPVRTCCCVVTKSPSCAQLFVTPQTVAHQVPLSVGFPRQRYWHGLPFPSSGDIHNTGLKPVSLHWQVDSLPLSHQGSPNIQIFYSLCLHPRSIHNSCVFHHHKQFKCLANYH